MHPFLGECTNTIITDQDKGSKGAIQAVLPGSFNFHCSFHRRQNIMKNCKGGVQEFKAAWLFNKLVNAKTPEAIERLKKEYSGKVVQRDMAYLKNLLDEEQYPAARCAMDVGVIMYGRSSSASVESMNAANREIRARTRVCLVNATILLMNLERERYETMKECAWSNVGQLTPRGSLLADEASKEVPAPWAYKWTVEEAELYHEYKVKGSHAMSQTQTLRVAKTSEPGDMGCRPLSCTCGVPRVDGVVPCRHAIAVAKSPAQRTGFTVVNSMPQWWTAGAWKAQFPKDDKFLGIFDLKLLKENYQPDNSIHYCPDFAGPRKKGRPKKNSRAKSPLEMAMEQHKGRKKKRMRVSDEELARGTMGGEGGTGNGAMGEI